MTLTIPAAHYRKGRGGVLPSIIVIHDEEAPERTGEAIAIANFFHNQPANDPNPTSVHAVADNATLVRCVPDADTAYAAGTTANVRGLHIEQSGYAKWTPADWANGYTQAQQNIIAIQVAAWCRAYAIPPVKLDYLGLRAGKKGICGHADVSKAWPKDTTHTDPGNGYPWAYLLGRVRTLLNPLPPPEAESMFMVNATMPDPATPGKLLVPATFTTDGVTAVRWVESPIERDALTADGVLTRPLPASYVTRLPIVGDLPPKGK